MSLQLREEVQAEDFKLGVMIIRLVFKAINLDKITEAMSIDKKEKSFEMEPWGLQGSEDTERKKNQQRRMTRSSQRSRRKTRRRVNPGNHVKKVF